MQQNLFILLYLTGISPLILSLGRKYYLIQEQKTWNDAHAYCQEHNTSLATIRNNDDMLRLTEVANSHQFTSKAWIGLYDDIRSWHWSFQNMPLGNVSFWKSGKPEKSDKSKICVLTDNREWSDEPCEQQNPFICFDDRNTSTKRYIFEQNEKTWDEAQRFCREQHTDLAIGRDANEAQALKQFSTQKAWIGLFSETWRWIDQSNVSSIVWKSGHPDDKYSPAICGLWNNGDVEDKKCSDTEFFFCHAEITGHKQIIRIKVHSKKNANEPDVKAAILEKIKDKLREVGVAENTTVTWWEQPDGKVFHKEEEKKDMEENNTCEP